VASLVFGAGGLGDKDGPHQPRQLPSASPAPMPRRRPSPGTGSRLWAPDVILGFAEYGLSPYISLPLSLSLFDRQLSFVLSFFSFALNNSLVITAVRHI